MNLFTVSGACEFIKMLRKSSIGGRRQKESEKKKVFEDRSSISEVRKIHFSNVMNSLFSIDFFPPFGLFIFGLEMEG